MPNYAWLHPGPFPSREEERNIVKREGLTSADDRVSPQQRRLVKPPPPRRFRQRKYHWPTVQKMPLLSGGQNSRVAFACFSLTNLHIVILDESSNQLDIETMDALSLAFH